MKDTIKDIIEGVGVGLLMFAALAVLIGAGLIYGQLLSP
jgi:hypothetical protein